jgi:hypothetical protein
MHNVIIWNLNGFKKGCWLVKATHFLQKIHKDIILTSGEIAEKGDRLVQ